MHQYERMMPQRLIFHGCHRGAIYYGDLLGLIIKGSIHTLHLHHNMCTSIHEPFLRSAFTDFKRNASSSSLTTAQGMSNMLAPFFSNYCLGVRALRDPPPKLASVNAEDACALASPHFKRLETDRRSAAGYCCLRVMIPRTQQFQAGS